MTLATLVFFLFAPALASDVFGQQEAFAAAADKAKPAVVSLTALTERRLPVSRRFFFGEPDAETLERFKEHPNEGPLWKSEGTGSGVLVDPRGLVVTNEHVLRGAQSVKVSVAELDGSSRTYVAELLAKDEASDLAVLRIKAPGATPWLAFAPAAKTKVGHWVLAIGSPFELQQTVTVGVVSAKRQSLEIEGRRYHDLVQTDAAINQGNSGGPLVDLDGEIVGINTAIYSPSGGSAGVGFAIAAADVRRFLAPVLAGLKERKKP